MTGNTRLIATGRPSAVPVHYYRNVSGEPVRIYLAEKELIARPMFYNIVKFV
jgi:hypothetical protein